MNSIAATPAPTGPRNRLLEATLLSSLGALAIAVCSVIPSLGQWWWLGLIPILSAVALLILDIQIGGRRQIMDRVLESMSDALGIPVTGTVQWGATESGAGWRARLVGTPIKLKVKLTVKAFDDLDLARKVAAATNEAWQPHRWGVKSSNPRRGRLVLSTLSGDEIVLDDIKNRIHSVVGRVFGTGSRVTKFKESGAEVTSFTLTHTRGDRLSSSQIQNQVTKVVSSQIPGRWRAHYDLPKDVVTFERRPQLPKRIDRPTTTITPGSPHWLEIPQAVDEDGEICYWDFSGPMAHQLKAGRTRTGKTVSLIGDAVEAARRGMRVFVADPKRIEFLGLRDWPNVALVATTTQDIVALLCLLNQMMEDRYHAIEKGEATETDYDHVFLLLDEYRIMVGRISEWYASIKVTGMPAKCPAIEWVGALLRMAAAARIHIILGTQRPDVEAVGGEQRDNFSSRGATGPLSPDGAKMMFDDHSIGTGIPIGLRGRGTWLGEDGTPKEVQYFYTPDPRKANSPEEWALLEALKPQTVTWPRQELDYGQAEIDSDSKAKQSLEWLQIQAARLVDYTGTVDTRPAAEQPGELDRAEDDAAEPEWVEVSVTSGDLKAGDQIELDGEWVTLSEDPLEEGDSVLLDWLNDDSDSGISAISTDEMLTIRRPNT